MKHTLKCQIVTHSDANYTSFTDLEFEFELPENCSQNILPLIDKQIRQNCWDLYRKNPDKSKPFLPRNFKTVIGQQSADAILQLHSTDEKVDTALNAQLLAEQQRKANSCHMCGQLYENCSILCNRQNGVHDVSRNEPKEGPVYPGMLENKF